MAQHTFKFEVKRKQAVLVAPCQPTPCKTLGISIIDSHPFLGFHAPFAQLYANNNPSNTKLAVHPATIVRQGLEKVLVPYYPFAGRLRDDNKGGKVSLDCNGEGVLFIEADADVSLSQLGDLRPPFPCWDELLYDVPGSKTLTDSPLLLIQVTQMKCGGFVFALRFNHRMCDGAGLVQFMNALAEMIQGEPAPSVEPIWQREDLLQHINRVDNKMDIQQYYGLGAEVFEFPDCRMEHDSFHFEETEIQKIKSQARLPHRVSTFEIIAAFVWKLRTQSLSMPGNQVVRFLFPVNGRGKIDVPKGYYGNVLGLACATTKAKDVVDNSLGFVVRLIQEAKMAIDEEQIKVSATDIDVIMSVLTGLDSFVISDLTKLGLDEVDYFGWGKPLYGGVAETAVGPVPGVINFFNANKTENGGHGVLLPICLPAPAMERFKAMRQQMLGLAFKSSL